MTSLMTSSHNILCGNFGINILETKPDSGMVPINSLEESAHELSIGHARDDVAGPDDVIMVTS